MSKPPIGALWGTPFLLLAVLKLTAVGGGVDGVKLCILLFELPLLLLLISASDPWSISLHIFLFLKFFDVPAILQPREQKVKESRRLRSQTRQVFVTPLPGLGWGLSFKKTILALFMIYVWTPVISKYFWISETLITSWYDDLLIWIALWSLWNERHSEQRAPFVQSRQYMLHSLLWASAWSLHWTKKLVCNRGLSHGGHLLLISSSSSSGPPPPMILLFLGLNSLTVSSSWWSWLLLLIIIMINGKGQNKWNFLPGRKKT